MTLIRTTPLAQQGPFPPGLSAQPLSSGRAIDDKVLGAATGGGGGGPTFSADPASAIIGSAASIWGDISALLQGQQTQKILAQQGQLTEKDQFNAIIALSQQQTAAAAAKQRTTLIVAAVVVLAALGVAAIILTRKTG
jgi:hypothetical protein